MEKAKRAKCNTCNLLKAVFVPSEVHNSKIVALAEAPGYIETKKGRPLVGVAGQDLDAIIIELGHKREDVNYLNVCNCRPTKIENGKITNRTPTANEISCCSERLATELEKIAPLIIVSMGKTPYTALSRNSNVEMYKVVGTKFIWQSKFDVIVTYHPAAISHSGGATTERGKEIRNNIRNAFKMAFEMKEKPKQMRLL